MHTITKMETNEQVSMEYSKGSCKLRKSTRADANWLHHTSIEKCTKMTVVCGASKLAGALITVTVLVSVVVAQVSLVYGQETLLRRQHNSDNRDGGRDYELAAASRIVPVDEQQVDPRRQQQARRYMDHISNSNNMRAQQHSTTSTPTKLSTMTLTTNPLDSSQELRAPFVDEPTSLAQRVRRKSSEIDRSQAGRVASADGYLAEAADSTMSDHHIEGGGKSENNDNNNDNDDAIDATTDTDEADTSSSSLPLSSTDATTSETTPTTTTTTTTAATKATGSNSADINESDSDSGRRLPSSLIRGGSQTVASSSRLDELVDDAPELASDDSGASSSSAPSTDEINDASADQRDYNDSQPYPNLTPNGSHRLQRRQQQPQQVQPATTRQQQQLPQVSEQQRQRAHPSTAANSTQAQSNQRSQTRINSIESAGNNNDRFASTTMSSSTGRRILNEAGNSQVRSSAPSTTTQSSRGSQLAFDVAMGADRMFIKPPLVIKSTTTTSSTTEPPMTAASGDESDVVLGVGQASGPINERRQDLLYPSGSIQDPSQVSGPQPIFEHTNSVSSSSSYPFASANDPLANVDLNGTSPTICYTPFALITIVLTTMLVTIGVCLCAHLLFKHRSKHQFDLVAKSKSFGTKSGPTSVATRVANFDGCGAGNFAREQQQQQLNRSSTLNDLPVGLGIESANYNLYKHNIEHSPGGVLHTIEDNNCYAFDNPYFSEARKDWLLAQQVQVQQQQQRYPPHASSPEAQQLHFIENRISTLHSRQVTSSVNELAGNVNLAVERNNNCDQHQQAPNAEPLYLANPTQVVDLTSASERAKVLADPKQGDLIAVDLTGHDFIGLGFDVCGNERNGIYVKSVLSRGPARDSGCIEPGDRIKCLNIAFDSITLSDACDLLNCAAPYKMRLLLEKRAIDSSEDLRKLSTANHANVSSIANHMGRERNSWSPTTTANMHPLALRDLAGSNQEAQLATMRAQRPNSVDNATEIGPLKTYLRRLSRLVAPGSDWLGGGGNSSQAQLRDPMDPYPLGSAAARMRAQSCMYQSTGATRDTLMSPVGLTNVGFCCDSDDVDDEADHNHLVESAPVASNNKRPKDIPLLRVDVQQRNKLEADTRMDLSKLGRDSADGNVNDNDNDGYYSDGDTTNAPRSNSPAMSPKSNLPGQLLPAQGRSRRQTVAGLCESAISSQLAPSATTNVSTSASKIGPITSTTSTATSTTSMPHYRRSTDAIGHNNKPENELVHRRHSGEQPPDRRSDPEIASDRDKPS